MLLVRGDYVWTGTELLKDAAVFCREGRIQKVGPWEKLRSAHPDIAVEGGPGIVVLPGLINAHHHGNGITSFMRGVTDDALEPWLARLVSAPPVDPYLDTLWVAIGVLEAGYTTMALFQTTADPSRAGEEARARIQACKDAGLRVAFGLDVMQQHFYVYGPDPKGLPPLQGLTGQAYISLLEELRTEYADDPFVTFFAAPSGPQWVNDETWEMIGAWTRENKVPLHTHCLESPNEAEYARRHYDGSAVKYLHERGALHEYTSLVHGVYLSDQEMALMAGQGTSLITNPGSNLRLRCGVSPVLAAMDHGIQVALGTDGCALGEDDDAFEEMRLLFYLQRRPGMDTPALTWEKTIQTATTAAAAVTPWKGRAGEIKEGMLADFSLFDLESASGPWIHPDLHPLQILLQRASSRDLRTAIVGGKPVWKDGQGPLRVSKAEVAACLQDSLRDVDTSNAGDYSGKVRAFYRQWHE